MDEMIVATDEMCKKCAYSTDLSHTTSKGKKKKNCCCYYIAITGRRRIRDASGQMCGCFKEGRRKKAKTI